MLDWLRQRKRMTGGLHFGPPGWSPHEIENHSIPPASPTAERPIPPVASANDTRDCKAFLELLTRAGITRTSTIIPSISEQIADLSDRRIRSLVLNLLPTQPDFALPAALSIAAFDELREGITALQNFIRARRLTLVIDRQDHITARRWKKARADSLVNFEIISLLNRYPQSHHTVLLRTLFGKKLLPSELPTRANRFVVDPVACWALGRFLRTSQPLSHRPVQIFICESPRRTVAPRVVMARLGEPVTDLLRRLGVTVANRQIILNGMLTGHEALPDAAIASDTESIAVRLLPLEELASPCIACGWCVDVCPTQLNPVGLFDLARTAQGKRGSGVVTTITPTDGESLGCIGCGLCSYVCPTRLPLMQELLDLRAQAEIAQSLVTKVNPGLTEDTLGEDAP